jgi:hypothetical protein
MSGLLMLSPPRAGVCPAEVKGSFRVFVNANLALAVMVVLLDLLELP